MSSESCFTKKTKKSPKAEVRSFNDDELNPFKNAKEFVQYYRAFVKNTNKDAEFGKFSFDAGQATEILDALKENHRDNKTFLNAWIRYFIENKLKGDKIYDIYKTSVKAFKETFENYNQIFYVPQS